MMILMMAMAMAMAQDEGRDGRRQPEEGRRGQDPAALRRQAEEIESKLAALSKDIEQVEGEKRQQMQQLITDLRAQLKTVNDQIARLEPNRVAPQPARERELVDQIGNLQRRIQNGEFKSEDELARLKADQVRLTEQLAELRAHARDMKGMHPTPPPVPVLPMAGLNEEQRRRMLDELTPWIKEGEPQTAERLNQLSSEKRWEEYDRSLRETYGRFQQLRDLKQRDPKEFERVTKMGRLEAESRKIGDDLRRTAKDDAKRGEMQQRLMKTLTELFEMREAGRWRELETLEAQVKELRKTLEARKEGREKIIEKRAKELAGERDDHDW